MYGLTSIYTEVGEDGWLKGQMESFKMRTVYQGLLTHIFCQHSPCLSPPSIWHWTHLQGRYPVPHHSSRHTSVVWGWRHSRRTLDKRERKMGLLRWRKDKFVNSVAPLNALHGNYVPATDNYRERMEWERGFTSGVSALGVGMKRHLPIEWKAVLEYLNEWQHRIEGY